MTLLVGAAALEAFAARLAPFVYAGDTIALSGELGAGKTSLARGLLRGLGHVGEVPSPTFTLMQVYEPPAVRLPVWHVDFYRFDQPADADALALEEGGHALTLIEWPERLGDRLDARALVIRIEGAGTASRRLTAHVPPAWEGRWPPR